MLGLQPETIELIVTTKLRGEGFVGLLGELANRGLTVTFHDEESGILIGTSEGRAHFLITQTPGVLSARESGTVKAMPFTPQPFASKADDVVVAMEEPTFPSGRRVSKSGKSYPAELDKFL